MRGELPHVPDFHPHPLPSPSRERGFDARLADGNTPVLDQTLKGQIFFRDLMVLTPPVGRDAASVCQRLLLHAPVVIAIVIILPATAIKMTGL